MSDDVLDTALALAQRHGIELDATTLVREEAGLDFRVVMGATAAGERWVLRVPRRPDMLTQIEAEGRVLDLVATELPVAVPRWTVRSAELVAYRALPGAPGLTLAADGEVRWRLDVTSRRYAEHFGRLLAALHGIPRERALGAGASEETPAQVRERWRRDLATVVREFVVAPARRAEWEAWLVDDDRWPTWSTFTHGELYPAHVLIDASDAITGVIDWSTAKISDPARDFAFSRALSTPELFQLTLDAYADAGGRTWPRLGEHAAAIWGASPITYGVFALESHEPRHRTAAQAQLGGDA
jgi:macrolide phosphotransferase